MGRLVSGVLGVGEWVSGTDGLGLGCLVLCLVGCLVTVTLGVGERVSGADG